MTEHDFDAFDSMMRGVYAYYGKDLTEQTIAIWWNGCRTLELEALRDGLNRHVMNPDTGQFLPKIADVVKMAEGTTGDSAARAWTLVDQAVRMVGPYRSVTFDDRITMRVIHDMGGWQKLCSAKDNEWPFVAREFQVRYKGFRIRGELPECPTHLIGMAEQENTQQGMPVERVMLIGNPDKAREIRNGQGALTYDKLTRPVLQLARAE
jgi:hypothetical protein